MQALRAGNSLEAEVPEGRQQCWRDIGVRLMKVLTRLSDPAGEDTVMWMAGSVRDKGKDWGGRGAQGRGHLITLPLPILGTSKDPWSSLKKPLIQRPESFILQIRKLRHREGKRFA